MRSMGFTAPLYSKSLSSSGNVPAMQTLPFIPKVTKKIICLQHGRAYMDNAGRSLEMWNSTSCVFDGRQIVSVKNVTLDNLSTVISGPLV